MLTLSSALARAERQFGERPAIIDRERRLTWHDFIDRVARAASVLRDLGVAPGERFAILSRNSFRQAELIHAGYWLGAIPVPVNIRLAPPEVEFILKDSGCKLVAIEDELWHWADTAELAPWADRLLHVSVEPPPDGVDGYEALLATAEPAPLRDAGEDDDAILLYTGGTTGRAKGVRLSHRNIVANGLQMAVAFGARAEDVYLHVAPMFHSADLLGTAFTLVGGGHAFLPQFSGDELLTAIQEYRATVTMLAPTMIIMALQEGDLAARDLSSLRTLFYGSSPMAVAWTRRAMAAFPGAGIQQGYGLTETSPILTTLDPDVHARALETGGFEILKSAGRPVIGLDMRLLGDDGEEVPMGSVGEVVVRGPNVTAGYLNRPGENARAFHRGWFRTGDVGRFDANGFLYLMDRKKDVIISGGENIYSSEVEAALYQHEGVFEAAVVGVPDRRYGEALFALIVPAPGAELTTDMLIAHCRERIGGYKIPRRMDFVDVLPKSAMGKVLKHRIRDIYGQQDAGEKP